MTLPGADPVGRDPEKVRAMFDRVAPRYDLANHLLSSGADFLWRRRASKLVESWQPSRVLDLACGSGDLALAMQRRLPSSSVIAGDFSWEMLAIARRKGVLQTVVADAMALPFKDGSFDCITVAFGLRNMQDWGAALREMARVLSGGGHLLVLDFSLPESALLRRAYRFYLHHVLPWLAAVVTGQKDAYEYLGASIEKFPSGEEMIQLMQENGFASAAAKQMSRGIVTLYAAAKFSG
jgi:demethylmenaquinone methyltransferase/2-methoxy-6-polyprenyl-1,4-benzoquinol methylase